MKLNSMDSMGYVGFDNYYGLWFIRLYLRYKKSPQENKSNWVKSYYALKSFQYIINCMALRKPHGI